VGEPIEDVFACEDGAVVEREGHFGSGLESWVVLLRRLLEVNSRR
jgi:hypothetical protein